jgi:4-hydroxy-4-methyl-2-oxoglutarate aldolase
MGQWIGRDTSRPGATTIEAFRGIPTGILSDCMNRQMAMDGGVTSLVPGRSILGPAFTVQSVESCNWGGHQALAMAQPGDVLVVAARGGERAAVWGHIMTVAARIRGLAGVIVDGCVRDTAENRADALPIFCRGSCPAGPHKGWPCNLNVPVSCAGVPVLPGDVIVGDDDGVVVVPLARAEEILIEARQRMTTEREWYRRIEAGESTLSVLGLAPTAPKGT